MDERALERLAALCPAESCPLIAVGIQIQIKGPLMIDASTKLLFEQVMGSQKTLTDAVENLREGVYERLDSLDERMRIANGRTFKNEHSIAMNEKAIAILEADRQREQQSRLDQQRQDQQDRLDVQRAPFSHQIEPGGKPQDTSGVKILDAVLRLPWLGKAVVVLLTYLALQGTLSAIIQRILAKWGM